MNKNCCAVILGSQYVNIDNLVRHILEVLDEENRRKAFGSIVVNVLTKDLLSSPKHRLTLVPHLLGVLSLCIMKTASNALHFYEYYM